MAKVFDVMVYDEDPNVPPKMESNVTAADENELRRLYGMCHQRIEIVHTRESEREQSPSLHKLRSTDDFTVSKPTGHSQNIQPTMSSPPSSAINTQPVVQRYFEVGGIKCKMENGKMYQKQWMRLNDKETSEFRIVSDKNNKICPLKDRHIEIMKWVLIEDENTSLTNSTEGKTELLNG